MPEIGLRLSQLADAVSKLSLSVIGAYAVLDLLRVLQALATGTFSPTALYHKIAAGYAANTAAAPSECFPWWIFAIAGLSLTLHSVTMFYNDTSPARERRRTWPKGVLAPARVALLFGVPTVFEHFIAGPVTFFAPPPAIPADSPITPAQSAIIIRWMVEFAMVHAIRIAGVGVETKLLLAYSTVWTVSRYGMELLSTAQGPKHFAWQMGKLAVALVVYVAMCRPTDDENGEFYVEYRKGGEQPDAWQKAAEQKAAEQAEKAAWEADLSGQADLRGGISLLSLVNFLVSLFTLVVPFVLYCRLPTVSSAFEQGNQTGANIWRVIAVNTAAFTAGVWFMRALLLCPISHTEARRCVNMAPCALAACLCVEFHRFQGLPYDAIGVGASSAAFFYVGATCAFSIQSVETYM